MKWIIGGQSGKGIITEVRYCNYITIDSHQLSIYCRIHHLSLHIIVTYLHIFF